MAMQNNTGGVFLTKSVLPAAFPSPSLQVKMIYSINKVEFRGVGAGNSTRKLDGGWRSSEEVRRLVNAAALGGGSSSNVNNSSSNSNSDKKKGVPNSNYVVPLDKSLSSSYSSCITRPLAEILRDLNKRIPDNIIKPPLSDPSSTATFIPWYHANRMLSFYAPGWCGEIRDVIFSENGSVTVVYRVTIRGSDGEAHRESTGTVSSSDGHFMDPVAAAEEIAFCRACARFGLGLYLYHEE